MKKILLFATVVAMALAVAMPTNAQTRKDKKAAKKEAWEMRQQFIKDSTERANKAKLDAMEREDKARVEAAERAEAERRAREAEAKARQKKAEEAAALEEKDFNEPCSSDDWYSTEDLLRGRGIGEDLDQQNSVDDARQAAIKEMAAQISTKVQDLVSRQRRSVKKNNDRASLVKVETMTVTEVEESTGFRKACSKTRTFVENGMRVFKTYYVVELPADKVLKNIYNKLQQDEDLQLDMNFDEFKKEFDKRFPVE